MGSLYDTTSGAIAIVGGGPAGLTCAWELRKRGWTNVTVFEKSREPGGKTKTVKVDTVDRTAQVSAELGTYLLTRSKVVEELLVELGLHRSIDKHRPMRFRDIEQGYDYHPLRPRQPKVGLLRRLRSLRRYRRALRHRDYLGQPGFAQARPEDGSRTINQWVKGGKFEGLEEALLTMACNTECGNGASWIPAAYFIKFMVYANRFNSFVKLTYRFPKLSTGNQEIWRRLAKTLDVRCSAEVVQVVREGKGWRIEAKGSQGGLYDRVVWTTDLPTLDAVLQRGDDVLSSGIRPLFRRVNYLHRAVLGFYAEGLPRDMSWLFPVLTMSQALNVPYVIYNVPGTLCYILYPWCEAETGLEELRLAARSFLEQLGGSNIREATQPFKTAFHPFFGVDDFKSGVYQRLEQAQGCDSLYLSGEIMSGITVAAAAEYARNLAERHF